MSLEKLRSKTGSWVFAVPISGLKLSKEINEEVTINKITFTTNNKLPRIRKRLGFSNFPSKDKFIIFS